MTSRPDYGCLVVMDLDGPFEGSDVVLFAPPKLVPGVLTLLAS